MMSCNGHMVIRNKHPTLNMECHKQDPTKHAHAISSLEQINKKYMQEVDRGMRSRWLLNPNSQQVQLQCLPRSPQSQSQDMPKHRARIPQPPSYYPELCMNPLQQPQEPREGERTGPYFLESKRFLERQAWMSHASFLHGSLLGCAISLLLSSCCRRCLLRRPCWCWGFF